MDETEVSNPGQADIGGVGEQDSDFEPTARPDDVFFAVVEVEHLSEVAAVHGQTDGNAVVLVRGEHGLRVRGRSYNCYWYDVDLPRRVLELFDGHDADFWIDPERLRETVRTTQSDRVALRGTPAGDLLLESPGGATDLSTDSLPLLEEDSDDAAMNPNEPRTELRDTNRFDPTKVSHVADKYGSFEVEAEVLQGIAAADAGHDHIALSVDLTDEVVEWSFFNLEGESHTVGLSIGPDRLASSLTPPDEDPLSDATIQRAICRNGFEQAVGTFRDSVEILVSHVPLSPVHTQYTRGTGELPVYTLLAREDGAEATLREITD